MTTDVRLTRLRHKQKTAARLLSDHRAECPTCRVAMAFDGYCAAGKPILFASLTASNALLASVHPPKAPVPGLTLFDELDMP